MRKSFQEWIDLLEANAKPGAQKEEPFPGYADRLAAISAHWQDSDAHQQFRTQNVAPQMSNKIGSSELTKVATSISRFVKAMDKYHEGVMTFLQKKSPEVAKQLQQHWDNVITPVKREVQGVAAWATSAVSTAKGNISKGTNPADMANQLKPGMGHSALSRGLTPRERPIVPSKTPPPRV